MLDARLSGVESVNFDFCGEADILFSVKHCLYCLKYNFKGLVT